MPQLLLEELPPHLRSLYSGLHGAIGGFDHGPETRVMDTPPSSGDNLRLAMRGACVTISKTQAGVITEVAEWIAGCCGWCEPVMIGRNDDAIVADGTSR